MTTGCSGISIAWRKAAKRSLRAALSRSSNRSLGALPLSFYVIENLGGVAFDRPDVAQEVRRMHVVRAKETAVATAAIHQLVRHLATQPRLRLFDDARQPHDPAEF